jgi:hypothetical protein
MTTATTKIRAHGGISLSEMLSLASLLIMVHARIFLLLGNFGAVKPRRSQNIEVKINQHARHDALI